MTIPPSPSALVTGCARGIGKAIAEVLLERGYLVHGVDIHPLENLGLVSATIADLANPLICEELIDEIRPDILVNNAACLVIKPIDELECGDLDRMIDVNFKAVFTLSRSAVTHMKERGWGRIVNISSIGARHGGVGDTAAYCATKGAVITLTKTFSRKFGPHGVTTNSVAPGATDTAMVAHLTAEERAAFEAQIPLRRLARPRDIATVVAFLVSDDASYVNGVTIDVNGGWYTA